MWRREPRLFLSVLILLAFGLVLALAGTFERRALGLVILAGVGGGVLMFQARNRPDRPPGVLVERTIRMPDGSTSPAVVLRRHADRGFFAGLAILALCCLVIAVFPAVLDDKRPNDTRILFGFCAGALGLAGLNSLRALRAGAYALALTPEGVVQRGFASTTVVRWQGIFDVGLAAMRGSVLVGLHLKPRAISDATASRGCCHSWTRGSPATT